MKQISDTADDDVAETRGVVASLLDLGTGNVRLNFDDVAATYPDAGKIWRHQNLFTFSDYPYSSVHDMTLSDEQYRDIGIALVARLVALNERPFK